MDVATQAVREGRSDQMTIRSLASELGVAPMSLYRHVRDKDDIFDEVTDRLLAQAWKPRAQRSEWRRWTMEAADRLRAFLVREPVALHVYLRHPVVSPAAIARMDAMLEVLGEAGLRTAGAGGHMALSTPIPLASPPWKPHAANQPMVRVARNEGVLDELTRADHTGAVQGRARAVARWSLLRERGRGVRMTARTLRLKSARVSSNQKPLTEPHPDRCWERSRAV